MLFLLDLILEYVNNQVIYCAGITIHLVSHESKDYMSIISP